METFDAVEEPSDFGADGPSSGTSISEHLAEEKSCKVSAMAVVSVALLH